MPYSGTKEEKREKWKNNKRKQRAQKTYEDINEWVYAFDIETSNTANENKQKFFDSEKKRYYSYTFMHQFTISRLNWRTGEVEHYFYGNWIEQLFDFFLDIFKQNKTTIVISHNYGGYESRLINQYEFIRDRTEDILCASPTKVLTQTLVPTIDDMDSFGGDDYSNAKIKILDSYLVLQKSIAQLGKELKFPKLDYNYDEFKLPTDNFTEQEIEYCYRDNDISLLGLYAKCNAYGWIKTPNDIPVSGTGFVRKELKNNGEINKDGSFRQWSALCKKMYIKSEPQLALFERAFNGGFTHCNPYFVGNCLKNLKTVDFKSDYPAQLINHWFPDSPFEPVPKDMYNKFLIRMKRFSSYDWRTLLSMRGLDSSSYVGEFHFYGVKLKKFDNKNVFPILSQSKTKSIVNEITIGEHMIVENGKIVKARAVNFCCTDVELLAIMLCYDIAKIEVVQLYKAHCGKTHREIINALNYFGIQKEQWKKVIKRLENDTYNRDDFPLLPDEQKDALAESEDKLSCANQYLMNAKGSLNGIYGQQVQKQIQDDYILTEEGCICIPKTLSDAMLDLRNLNHSFPIGIFVTSWARLSLTLGFLMLVEAGCSFVYADTDSLKILPNGDASICQLGTAVNDYNKIILSLNPKENQHGFGVFDFEEDYVNFVSLGAKKYLVQYYVVDEMSGEEKLVTKMTVAGFNKSSGSNILHSLFVTHYHYDFALMAHDAFNHNTYYTPEVTRKLAHSDYYQGEDMSKYYPELKGHDVKSMLNLEPVGFYMNETNGFNKTTDGYAMILDKVFHNPQDFTKTSVHQDEHGFAWVEDEYGNVLGSDYDYGEEVN